MDTGLETLKPLPNLKDIDYDEIEDIYNYISHSNKERTYLVMAQDRTKRKDWTCTCLDFMYRKKDKGQECKHIQRVKFIDEMYRKIDLALPQNKDLLHDHS
jgi:predicted RNase H-related nuclease YkuK (DUF458 family)